MSWIIKKEKEKEKELIAITVNNNKYLVSNEDWKEAQQISQSSSSKVIANTIIERLGD